MTMRMKKKGMLVLAVVLVMSLCSAVYADSGKVDGIRNGVLSNGITYTIVPADMIEAFEGDISPAWQGITRRYPAVYSPVADGSGTNGNPLGPAIIIDGNMIKVTPTKMFSPLTSVNISVQSQGYGVDWKANVSQGEAVYLHTDFYEHVPLQIKTSTYGKAGYCDFEVYY